MPGRTEYSLYWFPRMWSCLVSYYAALTTCEQCGQTHVLLQAAHCSSAPLRFGLGQGSPYAFEMFVWSRYLHKLDRMMSALSKSHARLAGLQEQKKKSSLRTRTASLRSSADHSGSFNQT